MLANFQNLTSPLRLVSSLALLATTALAASPAFAAPVRPLPAQCVGESIGSIQRVGEVPSGMALAGDRFVAVHRPLNSADRQFGIYERSPQGEFQLIESATDFPLPTAHAQSMTFDGERVQVYVATLPPSVIEFEKDAAGAWQLHETVLSGDRWLSGEVLARDGGRWAALTAQGQDQLVANVLERNAAGRLELVASPMFFTRRANAIDCVATVALDGDQMLLRSGGEQRGALQVVERRPSGQWRRTGHLLQPAGTGGYYGGDIDIQGDVAVAIRRTYSSQATNLAHVYQRDASSPVGWTLVQTVRSPRSDYVPFQYDYLRSVTLSDDRLLLGGGNGFVSQVLRRQGNAPLRFVPETTINGFGNQVHVGPDYYLGENLAGEGVIVTPSELLGHERIAVCLAAGTSICVDPSHALGLTVSLRQYSLSNSALFADVEHATPGSTVFLLGSDVLQSSMGSGGPLCVGPAARRTIIPLADQGAGIHSGVADLTWLPIRGGFTWANNGETWYFQAAGFSSGVRELSSAVEVMIRL